MIELRLNDRCPVCGSTSIDFSVNICNRIPTNLRCKCTSCSSDVFLQPPYVVSDNEIVLLGDNAVDQWNELSGRKNDG